MAEINNLFGVTNASNANTACFFANGDGGAQNVHLEGATFQDNTWRVVGNTNFQTGSLRVNYLLLYFG